jgi:hypothetical protein
MILITHAVPGGGAGDETDIPAPAPPPASEPLGY